MADLVQNRRSLLEYLISDHMAMLVIDHLKIVDIYHKYIQPAASGLFIQIMQQIAQRLPVIDAGQCIVRHHIVLIRHADHDQTDRDTRLKAGKSIDQNLQDACYGRREEKQQQRIVLPALEA